MENEFPDISIGDAHGILSYFLKPYPLLALTDTFHSSVFPPSILNIKSPNVQNKDGRGMAIK